MSERAVLIGGFVTGKGLLDPAAEAIRRRFGFSEIDVFTFIKAFNEPEKLERALKGQTAIVLSAGLLAITQFARMERLAAFNSPEKTSVAKLAGRYAIKSGHSMVDAVRGPQRRSPARVLASNNFQTIAHPLAYGRQIRAVSGFSTTERLAQMESASEPVRTARIDTTGCEFFGPNDPHPWDGKSLVLPGRHDQLILDPKRFLEEIPDEALEF